MGGSTHSHSAATDPDCKGDRVDVFSTTAPHFEGRRYHPPSRTNVADEEVTEVLLRKKEIVNRLVENGDIGTARKVESMLPDQVDTDRDHQILYQLRIDIKGLLNNKQW